MPAEKERIAKRIARAGICSRREAEKLIEAGKVKVNHKTIKSAALNVSAEDVIHVNGKLLGGREPTRLWLYHKPVGLVTTHKDPEGRPTVFDTLRDQLPRVISIGRLDLTSEGVLLLTNDGELSRHLELPSTGWVRRYRVRVFGRPTTEHLARLKKGIEHEGVKYGPILAQIDAADGAKKPSKDFRAEKNIGASRSERPEAENNRAQEREQETSNKPKSNTWLTVSLKEGKNREIRKVFEALGFRVSRLIRTAYGPFQLGVLGIGEVKEVPRKMLVEQLGKNFPLQ